MAKGMMDSVATQSLKGIDPPKKREDQAASLEGMVDQQDIPPLYLQLEVGGPVEVSHD